MLYFIVFKRSANLLINSNFVNYIQGYKHLLTSEKLQDNPHYHAIIDSDKTDQTIRNAINRLEPERKNKLQLKVVKDLPRAVVYILKELKVISNTLLTDAELKEYTAQTIAINIDKENKMTPRQSLIHNYIPLALEAGIEDRIDWQIQAHISCYVNRHYPSKNPFSKKHMMDVAWAIWFEHYRERASKNNFLF